MKQRKINQLLKQLSYSKEKGVAGLNVYLSIIVMIFVIGLIIAIFTIMGVKMKDTITDTEGKLIINETYSKIGDATDWFGLIILLGAMVVLILLVVIIINSIRQSGMTGEGGA